MYVLVTNYNLHKNKTAGTILINCYLMLFHIFQCISHFCKLVKTFQHQDGDICVYGDIFLLFKFITLELTSDQ